MSENKLITFADLAGNLEAAIQRDQLNSLLNKPPREAWTKKHPLIKIKDKDGKQVALEYIPISNVRLLMRAIFQRVRREVKDVRQVANAIQAIVRVHYRDPLTGEWDWQDGVGAAPIQLDSGSNASDLSSIKTNAIQIASPAAVSYAYKNACEEIGKIFGADLQKIGIIEFSGIYDQQQKETPPPPPADEEDAIDTKF